MLTNGNEISVVRHGTCEECTDMLKKIGKIAKMMYFINIVVRSEFCIIEYIAKVDDRQVASL